MPGFVKIGDGTQGSNMKRSEILVIQEGAEMQDHGPPLPPTIPDPVPSCGDVMSLLFL